VQCEGGSDDLDVPIDSLFHDAEVRSKFNLGSLNSVNIVRLLMQASLENKLLVKQHLHAAAVITSMAKLTEPLLP